MGMGGDSQAMHVPKTTAMEIGSVHASHVVLGSLGGPSLRAQHELDCSNHIGPISDLGHSSAFNSKKVQETDGRAISYSQEVEDTIRVGVGLGIQLDGFEN
ncbi:hypothetical protein L1987_83333 [Smallanthus sonchifolius]|uniref:Uncharacterized protein n=1 Tax=Smallanthus sonchifolius TaxID=185202 RepID=A0ACB8YDD3_9ASTR|nr:hypothetical protein L1987_83333 [Smallanthus sonchifolius]